MPPPPGGGVRCGGVGLPRSAERRSGRRRARAPASGAGWPPQAWPCSGSTIGGRGRATATRAASGSTTWSRTRHGRSTCSATARPWVASRSWAPASVRWSPPGSHEPSRGRPWRCGRPPPIPAPPSSWRPALRVARGAMAPAGDPASAPPVPPAPNGTGAPTAGAGSDGGPGPEAAPGGSSPAAADDDAPVDLFDTPLAAELAEGSAVRSLADELGRGPRPLPPRRDHRRRARDHRRRLPRPGHGRRRPGAHVRRRARRSRRPGRTRRRARRRDRPVARSPSSPPTSGPAPRRRRPGPRRGA